MKYGGSNTDFQQHVRTVVKYLLGAVLFHGSILELYRNILGELDLEPVGSSRTRMTRQIKQQVKDTVIGKKMKIVLIIDEASLLHMDVFAELHTLTQFDNDS